MEKNIYQSAIVEDEPQIREYIRKTLSESFSQNHIAMSFDTFASGESFLSMFQEHYHYDVIFLDIEMDGIDGIQTCKRIREISPDALVVFISNKEELVFQTFEVQPFRFIRKSEYASQLPGLVHSIEQKIGELNPHRVQVREPVSGDIYSFDAKKIVYVEAQRKACRIVTTTGEHMVQCKLMDLEKILATFSFLKPHRSYLVNCAYIFYIGKNSLSLTTKSEIPLSRNKVEEIKQQFLAYSVQ